MPMLFDPEEQPGLQPFGIPPGMALTRDDASPPIRSGGPLTSDLQGQEAFQYSKPPLMDQARAAFERENEIVSAAKRLAEHREFSPEPGYVAWPDIEGTHMEEYKDRFLGSRSRAETEHIRARVQHEIDNARLLAMSGMSGFLLQGAASIASPTTLLPGGVIYKGLKAGRAARSALSVGAAAAGGIAVQEGALHATQDTRTVEESIYATLFGAALGGTLGAGLSGVSSRALAKASRQVEAYGAEVAREGAEIAARTSAIADAGAAVTRRLEENRLASAFGTESAFARYSPLTRVLSSTLDTSRDIVTRLAEPAGMMLEQNKRGIPTGPPGGAVEMRIKVEGDLALYRASEALHKGFAEHRFGKSDALAPIARSTIQAVTGQAPAGKLSWSEFKREVTQALRNETKERGIEHAIPEVEKAAKAIRKDLFDVFKNEGQKVGLFDKEIDFAVGYVMRRYDVEHILRNQVRFRQILVDWLKEGQAGAAREIEQLEKELRAIRQAEDAAAGTGVGMNEGKAPAEGKKLRKGQTLEDVPEPVRHIDEVMEEDGRLADDLRAMRDTLPEGQREQIDAEIADIEARIKDNAAQRRQLTGWMSKAEEANTKLLEELRRLEPTLEGDELATVRKQISDLETRVRDPRTGQEKAFDAIRAFNGEPVGKAAVAPEQGSDFISQAAEAVARMMDTNKAPSPAAKKLQDKIREIENFRSLDEQELDAIARETVAKITGQPGGRMFNPYSTFDLPGGPRGPALARTLKIPDAKIAEFLDDDIERIAHSYVRTMAPDVALLREFGTLDFTDNSPVLAKMQDEIARRAGANEAMNEAMARQAMKDARDIQAMVSRLRGTYNLEDPLAWGPFLARQVIRHNYLTRMGQVLLSSVPDVMRVLMVGKFGGLGDALSTMVTDLKGLKLSMLEAKEMSAGLEMIRASGSQLRDVLDDFGGHSKFDRVGQVVENKFGRMTLMDPWNATLKQLTGAIAGSNVLKASLARTAGEATEKQITRLAASGIGDDLARAIADQYAKHGGNHGRLLVANVSAWDDELAANAIRSAVRRDVDKAIVSVGQERPFWISGTYGRVLGQFKTFALASVYRTMIAGLQERDAAIVVGAVGMLALGMLGEQLKIIVNAKERKNTPQHMGDWLYAGLANSGLLGWITDLDQTMHKVSHGKVSAARLIFQNQRPVSRYASQNASGALLGPTFGSVQDFITAAGAAADGQITQQDIQAIRRQLWLQNWIPIARPLRQLEEGLFERFGITKTRPN